MKTERFADNIRSNFAQGKGILFEIPERLFAAGGLVYSRDGCVLITNVNKESVIRAKRELTFDLKVAVFKCGL